MQARKKTSGIVELLLWIRVIVIDVVDSCNCCYGFVALLLWIRIELSLWIRINIVVVSCSVAMESLNVTMNSCSCCHGFVPLLSWIRAMAIVDS